MDNIITKLQGYLEAYGPNIIGAILIIVIGRIVASVLKRLVRKIMLRSNVDETLVSFVTSLGYGAFMAFVVVAALGKLGLQTTSFVAIIGAAGLAIGLALQGSLSNFAAGALMIIFKPFKIGDFIEGAGISGVVEVIGIFTTELKSPDNKQIIVPNAKMTGDNIINYTAKELRRVDLVAGVGYGDDLDKVRSVLEDILSNDKRILKDPAPTIAVVELADSSVNFVVRPWVKTADYWDVYFATQESIKKRFDAAGISIPFPQQDVYMHTVE
ncbi:MAG: mechanosensitive ion channel [bacterium]|nr:mechanosensitive ion channel [bacterium]MCP4799110.1 mechanosensitive ion channel [bacterium]